MAADGRVDTSRTAVKTYVPAYQRDEWDAHAEDLDMSRSEFVRSMVQAGRRGFEGGQADPVDDAPPGEPESDTTADREPVAGHDGTAAAEGFEDTVLEALERAEYLSWDELLDALTRDIETKLEDTLQDLQAANQVRYSGPNGGYTLDT